MSVLKKERRDGSKNSILLIVGIMAFYVVMADFTLLTPALETIYQHFAETTSCTTVLMSVSITGIVSFPSSIAFGMLYDRVGYKRLGLVGMLIVAVGGSFPFFFAEASSYGVVLLSRFVVGLGLGAINPVGAALITRYFTGAIRVRLLGIGQTVFYSAATLFSLISGALVMNGWNYAFLGYATAILPFVAVLLFLKEPETSSVDCEASDEALDVAPGDTRIPFTAYGYLCAWLLYAIVNCSIVQLMSTMIAQYEIGSPIVAGIASSAFTIGGVVGGLAFFRIHKILGKWMLSILFSLAAFSAFGLFLAKSLPAVLVMTLIDGCVNVLLLSLIQKNLGDIVPPRRIASANGVLAGFTNLGAFLGAYYISAVGIVFPGLGLMGTRLVTGVLLAAAAFVSLRSVRHKA